MPSTLTHYVFNKQLVKDKKYEDIFLLGGQGADVIFFYGYSLFKREHKKEIRQFGFDIHAIDPDKLYMEMLRYTFSKNAEEREILLNFVRGFMYHYALDRNVHPYVFYNTGFPYTNPIYKANHGIFEGILDTLVVDEYNVKISTRKSLKTKSSEVKICSKLIAYVAKEIFNLDYVNEDTYYKSYKDFRFVRLIIDSKYGVKKAIFNKLLKNNPLNTLCQPHKVKDDDKYDYLNKKHKEWLIPTTGESTRDSVKDLFNKSIMDTRVVDTIIYNYKDNIVTQRKITKFTNNTNHDGRNLDKFMTYFKTIWEAKND